MYNTNHTVLNQMEKSMWIIALLLTLLVPNLAQADQISDQIWDRIQNADELTGDSVTKQDIDTLSSGQKRLFLIVTSCSNSSGYVVIEVTNSDHSFALQATCR
jgi:ABC-type molybdenum transport system ATPase subunit/photorepair protein PhrA